MSGPETKLELISNGMQLEVGLKLEINKLLHQLGQKGEVGYWAEVGQDGWIKVKFFE